MKLIVGLGNPGITYAGSRHNIGFSVIKALAKNYKVALKKEKGLPALSGRGRIGDSEVVLAIPLTFMNLSGVAVAGLLKKYRLSPDNLLVVCDDMDLDFGRLKIRSQGSSGGHRGLASIIEGIGKKEFGRLRIGIGRPAPHTEPSEYVLTGFSRSQKCALKSVIEEARGCCLIWVEQGITDTMNIFNQRSKRE